jgi:hypothetical protein
MGHAVELLFDPTTEAAIKACGLGLRLQGYLALPAERTAGIGRTSR